jgi:hypothetical protein
VIANVCEADVREIAESASGVQDIINLKLGQVPASPHMLLLFFLFSLLFVLYHHCSIVVTVVVIEVLSTVLLSAARASVSLEAACLCFSCGRLWKFCGRLFTV